MKKVLAILFVGTVVAGLALAGPPQAYVAEREAALQALLVEKLGDDAAPIRVTITATKAILTGEVSERATQELCEEVALYFPGIADVDNQVKALHDDKLGADLVKNEAMDADLEVTVKMKLRAEIGVHAERIEVEAVEGIVSLRGLAPERARKTIALETTAKVKGVRKVIDLLRVP